MIFNLQFGTKSYFTPALNLNLYSSSISEELRSSLADIVLKEERYIIETYPTRHPDKEWLSGRVWYYNLFDFDYEAIRQLKEHIKNEYISYMKSLNTEPEKVYIQCWANIIRNNGMRMSPHHHADGHSLDINAPQEYSYLSGNLCVQTFNTSTWFQSPFLDKQVIPLNNVDGEIIFFPSFLRHWTDCNESETPRITISFDIVTEPFYEIVKNNSNYRLL
jgi:hypothetical protein